MTTATWRKGAYHPVTRLVALVAVAEATAVAVVVTAAVVVVAVDGTSAAPCGCAVSSAAVPDDPPAATALTQCLP